MSKTKNFSIYLAYGSNLDLQQMGLRCPDAVPIGIAEIPSYQLMFKGSKSGNYATIEKNVLCKVPVLVWAISKADENRLDIYEGHPTFYYKKTLPIENFKSLHPEKWQNTPTDGMAYIMHEDRHLGMPSPHYLDILYRGYKDLNLPMQVLVEALDDTAASVGEVKAVTTPRSDRNC